MSDECGCGTTGCDPCVCGHPWSEHADGTGCLAAGCCPCTKFDPRFKAHFFMPGGTTPRSETR